MCKMQTWSHYTKRQIEPKSLLYKLARYVTFQICKIQKRESSNPKSGFSFRDSLNWGISLGSQIRSEPMEYLKWAGQGIRSAVHAYNSINPATLSGAIDIVVCEHENGDLVASPFQVRFGKLGVLSPKEKIVHLSVNGSTVKEMIFIV